MSNALFTTITSWNAGIMDLIEIKAGRFTAREDAIRFAQSVKAYVRGNPAPHILLTDLTSHHQTINDSDVTIKWLKPDVHSKRKAMGWKPIDTRKTFDVEKLLTDSAYITNDSDYEVTNLSIADLLAEYGPNSLSSLAYEVTPVKTA